MKTKLLYLAAFFAAFFQLANAQCVETVDGFNNNTSVPMYNISGDVSVTVNLDNTVTLDLADNFMTAEGPDIRAYFVKSNGASDTTLKNTLIANLDNIEFGIVGDNTTPINGAKSFTISIPTNDNIEDYDKIFFYCLTFNQFWDLGTFTSFNTTNCALLSVDENELLNNVSFYPNPTNNQIEISNPKQLTLDINLYNVLGKKVLEANTVSLRNQTINLSSLNSGVYLVEIKAEGKSTTKKLIKQ